jgi:hypothetical protein
MADSSQNTFVKAIAVRGGIANLWVIDVDEISSLEMPTNRIGELSVITSNQGDTGSYKAWVRREPQTYKTRAQIQPYHRNFRRFSRYVLSKIGDFKHEYYYLKEMIIIKFSNDEFTTAIDFRANDPLLSEIKSTFSPDLREWVDMNMEIDNLAAQNTQADVVEGPQKAQKASESSESSEDDSD